MSNKIKQESQITVFDNFADGNIEVLFQDEVHLDVDVSLFYIKSGQEEIQYYVDHVSKPEIEDYTTGKISEISAFVASKEEESEEGIETYVEETIKPAIQNHVDTEIIPELEEYKSQVSALASAASGSAADAVISASEASASASSATSSATTAAENADLSQAWAVKMDGKVEDTDYSSKYYAQQSADKFAEIPAAVDSGLSALANASNALRTTQITNCITEIPQDIKLELADGVLTLKAGSKMYNPDGTSVVLTNDIASTEYNASPAENKESLCVISQDLQHFRFFSSVECFSQSEDPSTQSGQTLQYFLWYNTTENKVYYKEPTTDWTQCFLPFCTFYTDEDSIIIAINQVFNGMGYIGKTVFALPGIKGLIPHGRNTDGTLNNQEFELDEVLVGTLDSTVPAGETVFIVRKQNSNQMISFFKGLFDARNTSDLTSDTPWYNLYYLKDENKFRAGNQVEIEAYVGGLVFCDEDYNITSFRPKTTFTAVDYSDSSWIAAQAMPGKKYINLTLGASGTVYTAPANGYFTLAKMANNGQHIYMSNGRISVQSWVSTTGYIQSFLPVQKGDSLNIGYTATGDTAFFRFVYAQGEE